MMNFSFWWYHVIVNCGKGIPETRVSGISLDADLTYRLIASYIWLQMLARQQAQYWLQYEIWFI